MIFHPPLQSGVLLRRYKRFFADIVLNGETVVAHVPNTGSLKGCLRENQPCLVSRSSDAKRKLPHTLQMVKDGESWVGVNTHLANQIVWEAFSNGEIPAWRVYDQGQREFKISAESRIDLVLWDSKSPDARHFVEIKNVTMRDSGAACFPDAETVRGQKHLRELMKLVEDGHSAEMVFLVQRNDCGTFRPARDIDLAYAELLSKAHGAGVSVRAYSCAISESEVRLSPHPLKLEI